jgi:hypothetical protein
MTDYMTAEEMKAVKPKKLRKKKDKKTSNRRTKKDEDAEEEEEEGEDDFGSRKLRDQGGVQDEATKEKESRAQSFLAAKAKANDKIQQSIHNMEQVEKGEPIYQEEPDSELAASLARVT